MNDDDLTLFAMKFRKFFMPRMNNNVKRVNPLDLLISPRMDPIVILKTTRTLRLRMRKTLMHKMT